MDKYIQWTVRDCEGGKWWIGVDLAADILRMHRNRGEKENGRGENSGGMGTVGEGKALDIRGWER